MQPDYHWSQSSVFCEECK